MIVCIARFFQCAWNINSRSMKCPIDFHMYNSNINSSNRKKARRTSQNVTNDKDKIEINLHFIEITQINPMLLHWMTVNDDQNPIQTIVRKSHNCIFDATPTLTYLGIYTYTYLCVHACVYCIYRILWNVPFIRAHSNIILLISKLLIHETVYHFNFNRSRNRLIKKPLQAFSSQKEWCRQRRKKNANNELTKREREKRANSIVSNEFWKSIWTAY